MYIDAIPTLEPKCVTTTTTTLLTSKRFHILVCVRFFHDWNIIQFSHKETSFEDIYKIHQILLDRISEYMATLMKTGYYGGINTTETTTMGSYVIRFMSESYIKEEDTMYDKNISSPSYLFFKAQYMNCMK